MAPHSLLAASAQKSCWSHVKRMSLPISTCSSLHCLGPVVLQQLLPSFLSASSLGMFLFILCFWVFEIVSPRLSLDRKILRLSPPES